MVTRRRYWLALATVCFAAKRGRTQTVQAENQQHRDGGVLPVEPYQPKSMLHAAETHGARARFPLIDFHTHITSGSADDATFGSAWTRQTAWL